MILALAPGSLAYLIVSAPIELAISQAGPTGPISVVLPLLWILTATAVMLVKPVRDTAPQQAATATEPSLAS